VIRWGLPGVISALVHVSASDAVFAWEGSIMKNYFYGIRAEDRLAGALTRLGHTASYYENSRGPADIFVTRGGRRLYIQVRSTRSTTVRIPDSDAAFAFISSRLSDVDLARLSKHAMKTRGQPAVGLTHGDYYWTWRVRATRDEYAFELLHHGWLPKRSLARSEVS
jgi:hypothetical protein